MKTSFTLLAFILWGTIAISQVVFNPEISKEIYFGPKNVYPISQSICGHYIYSLNGVKESLDSLDVDLPDLDDFLIQIHELQSQWQDALVRIVSFEEFKDGCFEHSFQDKKYPENALEIEEFFASSPLEIIEYIDLSIIQLNNEWKKTRVKNCYSPDPEDCMVLCLVRNKKVYQNNDDEEIDPNVLFSEYQFEESNTNKRIFRVLDLELHGDTFIKLRNTILDEDYSLMEMEKIDCN